MAAGVCVSVRVWFDSKRDLVGMPLRLCELDFLSTFFERRLLRCRAWLAGHSRKAKWNQPCFTATPLLHQRAKQGRRQAAEQQQSGAADGTHYQTYHHLNVYIIHQFSTLRQHTVVLRILHNPLYII